MNSSPSRGVPLVCRFVRVWSAYASDAPASRPTSGVAARHVAQCAECRRYFAAADQLDRELVRDAQRAPRVPAGMEERIFQAVKPSLVSARKPARRVGWGVIAVAVSGVAAVAVFNLFWTPEPIGADAPEQKTMASTSEPAIAPLQSVAETNLWTSLLPTASVIGEENPLQQEIVAVQSDGRAALRFLARNFLPTNSVGGAPEASQRTSS
jgi:hypothetical protein